MKPFDVNPITYIDLGIEKMIKILNLKLLTLQEYQNIKIFMQKVIFQIAVNTFLRFEIVIILCRGHMQ